MFKRVSKDTEKISLKIFFKKCFERDLNMKFPNKANVLATCPFN